MAHKWTFEKERITKAQLERITSDFKRVLPYLEAGHKFKGKDFQKLWSAFSSEGYREFFFGFSNAASQWADSDLSTHNEAIQVFLLIAKKHLEHDIHVDSDQTDEAWRKGTSLCQNILGHAYDLMDITENGKLRFKTWEVATYGK
jgi:hypothetical protein